MKTHHATKSFLTHFCTVTLALLVIPASILAAEQSPGVKTNKQTQGVDFGESKAPKPAGHAINTKGTGIAGKTQAATANSANAGDAGKGKPSPPAPESGNREMPKSKHDTAKNSVGNLR